VAAMDLFAALLALFVLRPVLAAHVSRTTALADEERRRAQPAVGAAPLGAAAGA